jgi:hypothetical protein
MDESARMSDADKRNATRAASDFIVEIYEPDGKTLIGIGRLVNLSVTGACIDTSVVLLAKMPLVVRLLMKKVHLLTLASDVMWVKPQANNRQYGVKFKPYPLTSKTVIEKYVQEYFAQQKGADFTDTPQDA